MPKYYEISEATAKRAKDMNSYSDYAPGSATAGYRAMVDEAYALAEKQKARVDPMYLSLIHISSADGVVTIVNIPSLINFSIRSAIHASPMPS